MGKKNELLDGLNVDNLSDIERRALQKLKGKIKAKLINKDDGILDTVSNILDNPALQPALQLVLESVGDCKEFFIIDKDSKKLSIPELNMFGFLLTKKFSEAIDNERESGVQYIMPFAYVFVAFNQEDDTLKNLTNEEFIKKVYDFSRTIPYTNENLSGMTNFSLYIVRNFLGLMREVV